jgi:hypothetical protein
MGFLVYGPGCVEAGVIEPIVGDLWVNVLLHTPDALMEGPAITSKASRPRIHGLGALTRRQRRAHQSTMTRINRTGILVQNDQVGLTDADLVRAALDCLI